MNCAVPCRDAWLAGWLPVQVALEMGAMVLCSVMLASILRSGKSYLSEAEEAEFMAKAWAYVRHYRWG